METFAKFYGNFNEYHGSFTWQPLSRAAAECSVDVDGDPHRALTDARTAAGVLRYMANTNIPE